VERAGYAQTVHFTHSDLWDEEAVRSHEEGWSNFFANLERILEVALGRSGFETADRSDYELR